jgi:hypothetical protein
MINMIVKIIEKCQLNNKMELVVIYYGFIINFSILIMIKNIFKIIIL